MLKKFFVVDCKTNEVVATIRIGAAGQVAYDDPPELRKCVWLMAISSDLRIAAIIFAVVGCSIRPLFRVMMYFGFIAAAFGFVLLYLGWWLEKSAKKSGAGNGKKKRHLYNDYAPSVGSWKDPYGLAQGEANNTPGKKTYYIVDSETNAIVDVKRLGKWGQRYVEWRGRRQKGGA